MTTAIIATTPLEMQEAGKLTGVWVERKLAEAGRELMLAHEVRDALKKAKLREGPALAQINAATRRVGFYEKVRAALAAGYYIIPPFRVEAFAIRVKEHSSPRLERSDNAWDHMQKPAAALPPGEGFYASPDAGRFKVDTVQVKNVHSEGTHDVSIYENGDDWLGVDLPLIAHRPEIIEAVHGAIEAKIFDVLGIAPESRQSDPIIVGQIMHWRRGRLPQTFFVAWWLDERDL
jgi:hypothetical protein